jgi:tight adherence protein C
MPRSSHADAHLAERLAAADIPCSPAEFRVRQVSWGLGCAAGSLVLFGIAVLNGMNVNPAAMPALGAAVFWFSFLARDWWLTHQVEERRTVITEELPTAIDLVTLSIMAGDSVPSAIARAAETMPSDIGSELLRVLADIRAGEPVVDALEGLKGRIPDYGIARFVDALCTGIERGAPLADVLRAQADDTRENRRRELIELGGKREVLMLVPVVFLIMPVVVLFALLPGLVSLNLIVP